jgi:sec-independent protein translocase protein TatA
MFEGILQPAHLLLIFGIALLMFGPQKLPQLGRGLGEAIRGFREGIATAGNKTIQDSAAQSQQSLPAAPHEPPSR